jgi:hypothetical protein
VFHLLAARHAARGHPGHGVVARRSITRIRGGPALMMLRNRTTIAMAAIGTTWPRRKSQGRIQTNRGKHAHPCSENPVRIVANRIHAETQHPKSTTIPAMRPQWQRLDLVPRPFQNSGMAHTYMKFDFGTDEETAQQARHKLDVWKQAFRLDKKLQYKLDRGEEPESVGGSPEQPSEGRTAAAPVKSKGAGKAHAQSKAEPKGKHQGTKEGEPKKEAAASNGASVTLLVRLYFSSHEKLSEQRWFDRIPSEEPFKSAAPRVIRHGDSEFEESEKHFADLG